MAETRGDESRSMNAAAGDRRDGPRPAPPFVRTGIAERVLGVLEMVRSEKIMALICGQSGIGKTTAARFFAKRNPGVMIRRGGAGSTPRQFLSAFADYSAIASVYSLTESLGEWLRNDNALLVVDDCDLMPENTLHAIRQAWDQGDRGVCFISTPAWLKRLGRGKSGMLDQFVSRVGWVERLPGLSQADYDLLLESYSLTKPLRRRVAALSGGNARLALNLLRAAERVGGQVTAQTIEEAKGGLVVVE